MSENYIQNLRIFSAPNMATDLAIGIPKPEVQLFTEQEHLDKIELGISGGIISFFLRNEVSNQTTAICLVTAPRKGQHLG